MLARRGQHRLRGLAGREQVARKLSRGKTRKRGFDQRSGRDGVDASPQDALNVVPELRERTVQ
jgi:hypothetical protein